MKKRFSDKELRPVKAIIAALTTRAYRSWPQELAERLKDDTYAAIPAQERGSRGITWVLQRISDMVIQVCPKDEDLKALGLTLLRAPGRKRLVNRVPILLSRPNIGKRHPSRCTSSLSKRRTLRNWVSERACGRRVPQNHCPNKAVVLPWPQKIRPGCQPERPALCQRNAAPCHGQ